MLCIYKHFNHLIKNQSLIIRLQFVLFGLTNNILSGTKYRVSPEGVSLMDETNKLSESCNGVSRHDATRHNTMIFINQLQAQYYWHNQHP
jgi:hypothetical protein